MIYYYGHEAAGSAVRMSEGDSVRGGIGIVIPPRSGHDAVILGIDQSSVA